jgi:hypothetical protein
MRNSIKNLHSAGSAETDTADMEKKDSLDLESLLHEMEVYLTELRTRIESGAEGDELLIVIAKRNEVANLQVGPANYLGKKLSPEKIADLLEIRERFERIVSDPYYVGKHEGDLPEDLRARLKERAA